MAEIDYSSPILDNDENFQLQKKQEDKERMMIMNYHQRFRSAEIAVSEKHRTWAILDKFDRGKQWDDAAIPPWVPKPVTNYIRYSRTIKRANLAANISKAMFYPVSEYDKDIVARIQKAYDHVWATEGVSRTIRRVIDRALLQGTGIAYVYVDQTFVGGKYFGEGDPQNALYEGKIKVKRWPNMNFFPDPDAYELDQCKFIETTEPVSLNFVKNNPAFREYCEANGTIKKLDELKSAQMEMDNSATGEILKRDTQPSQNNLNQSGDEMVTLHTHWERFLNDDNQWQLNVTYYMRDVHFALLRIEDVQPNVYPFAIFYDEEEEQDIWGSSTAMDILENQKVINKTQQVASIIGVLHQNPQKVVNRESGINAQELARTGTLPGKVWTSNMPADQAISVIKPQEIPEELFTLDDRMQNNVREFTGINEAYTGESVGSLTTSTGVDSLINRATIRDKDKAIQIDEMVERLSDIIVRFILVHWREERPISIPQPNGETQFENYTPIDPKIITNLEWTVKSNVYARSPQTQASKRQQADKLLQMQGQFQFNPPVILPEEWILFQEFDDEIRSTILSRMEKDRAALKQQQSGAMVQQIMELVQQAGTAMDSGMPPEQVRMIVEQMAQQIAAGGMGSGPGVVEGTGVGQNPQQVAAPQGTTNEVAMANMANGGM